MAHELRTPLNSAALGMKYVKHPPSLSHTLQISPSPFITSFILPCPSFFSPSWLVTSLMSIEDRDDLDEELLETASDVSKTLEVAVGIMSDLVCQNT